MKKKVVAAGHACLDITPVLPRSWGCRRIGDVLVPGRLIQMEGVSISSGGSVSNTGLAMRLLGAEVCLMAKTGMDEFGKILADIYRKYGAADGIIAVQGEKSQCKTKHQARIQDSAEHLEEGIFWIYEDFQASSIRCKAILKQAVA